MVICYLGSIWDVHAALANVLGTCDHTIQSVACHSQTLPTLMIRLGVYLQSRLTVFDLFVFTKQYNGLCYSVCLGISDPVCQQSKFKFSWWRGAGTTTRCVWAFIHWSTGL